MFLSTGTNLFAQNGSEHANTLLMIISTLAMTGIALLSSLRHLGVQHALLYFGIIVVIELLCEQVNIMTGGLVFGELEYPDGFFGPKIFDVPIAVPLAMCAINWPINILKLHRVLIQTLKETAI